jgi:hypothetical protein
MTLDQILNLVHNVGLGATVVVSVLWAVYQLGKTLIDKVLVPVGEAHVDYLRASTASMKAVADQQVRIVQTQEAISTKLDNLKGEKSCVYLPSPASLLPSRSSP